MAGVGFCEDVTGVSGVFAVPHTVSVFLSEDIGAATVVCVCVYCVGHSSGRRSRAK